MKEMDIYNASQRTYHLNDGTEFPPGRTATVSEEEGETKIKSYPREIVSPDSYRAEGGKSRRDLLLEVQRVQAENETLKANPAAGGDDQTKELRDKLAEAQAVLLTNAETIVELTKNLEDAEKTLEQVKADASTMIEAAQKETTDAKTELEAFKEATKIALEAEEKSIDDQIAEYNAALDTLPDGAKAPHFVLTETQPGS